MHTWWVRPIAHFGQKAVFFNVLLNLMNFLFVCLFVCLFVFILFCLFLCLIDCLFVTVYSRPVNSSKWNIIELWDLIQAMRKYQNLQMFEKMLKIGMESFNRSTVYTNHMEHVTEFIKIEINRGRTNDALFSTKSLTGCLWKLNT